LNRWLEKETQVDTVFLSVPAAVSSSTRLIKVANLVLFEIGDDERSLILLQDELGDELAQALNLDQLEDVDFIGELSACLLVPLELLVSLLEPGPVADKDNAEEG